MNTTWSIFLTCQIKKSLFQKINDDSDDGIPPPAAEPGFNLSNVDALEVEENEDGEDPTNCGQFNNM